MGPGGSAVSCRFVLLQLLQVVWPVLALHSVCLLDTKAAHGNISVVHHGCARTKCCALITNAVPVPHATASFLLLWRERHPTIIVVTVVEVSLDVIFQLSAFIYAL